MRKTFISLLIAVSAVGTAFAEPVAPTKESFEHDGYTYVYEVTKTARGQTLTGTRYPDKTAFTLNVRDGQVEGLSNGQPVTFSVADARGAAKGAVSR